MPFKLKQDKQKYQREWCAKRREEYFKDKSCLECGSTYRLELDHIDPDDKLSHRIWSWSKQRRELELSKCQVLCHDHHLEKTIQDLKEMPSRKHGTLRGYLLYSCRCESCITYGLRHIGELKRYLEYSGNTS